jgi:bifunctional enzyme CysN/CysC
MATGASTADLAVVLIDARKGMLAQTQRHLFICSLLGIRHVIAAINKMDLVGYAQPGFDAIAADIRGAAARMGFGDMVAIPMAARFGENVAMRSPNMPWYRGPTLLEQLETADVAAADATGPFRFPVQLVARAGADFRGYAGTVASGRIARGDTVIAAESCRSTRIADIVTFDGSRTEARAGDAVTLTFTEPLDVARGDVLASPETAPQVSDHFAAHLIWMDGDPLVPGRSYLLRIGTRTVAASITTLKYKVDVTTQAHIAAQTLELNDIAFCNVATLAPIAIDAYAENRRGGAFILIDRFTNRTLGAGMIAFGLRRGTNVQWQQLLIGKAERAELKKQKPAVVWLTGLPAAGKSTIANLVDQQLYAAGYHTMLLDGDNLRHGLNRDLGFTEADRVENIRRAGEVARLMADGGLIVICAFISPYRAERETVRSLVGPGEFIEVFVDTPLDDCMQRDPKGLYAKARSGKIVNFTGVDAPYEAPAHPEVHLATVGRSPAQCAQDIVSALVARGIIRAA